MKSLRLTHANGAPVAMVPNPLSRKHKPLIWAIIVAAAVLPLIALSFMHY